MNPLKVLDGCLDAHKSISFSKVDGEYRYSTAAGSRTAPDLETLFRELGYNTADSILYQAREQEKHVGHMDRNAAAIFSGLHEGDSGPETLPAPPPDAPDEVFELNELEVIRAEAELGLHSAEAPPFILYSEYEAQEARIRAAARSDSP